MRCWTIRGKQDTEHSLNYDEIFGIYTENRILLDNKYGYNNYHPTPYKILRASFMQLPFAQSDHLVDIGCGLGRALFLAAYMGCCKLTGLELNEEIHRHLVSNIRHFHIRFPELQCDIASHQQDAKEYSFPNDVNKVFFFNPFHIKYFVRVLDNIEHSLRYSPRSMTLFLYYPYDEYLSYLYWRGVFNLHMKIDGFKYDTKNMYVFTNE